MRRTIKLDKVALGKDGNNAVFSVTGSNQILWDNTVAGTYSGNLGSVHTGRYGTFKAIDADAKTYSYTTDWGGEYKVDEPTKQTPDAYIVTFDASQATTKVTFDGTKNTKLTRVSTGSGRDAISVGTSEANTTVSVNAGAGNDTITVTKGNAVLTGGAGADTFVLAPDEPAELIATYTNVENNASATFENLKDGMVLMCDTAQKNALVWQFESDKAMYAAERADQNTIQSGDTVGKHTITFENDAPSATDVTVRNYLYHEGDRVQGTVSAVDGGYDGTFDVQTAQTYLTHDEGVHYRWAETSKSQGSWQQASGDADWKGHVAYTLTRQTVTSHAYVYAEENNGVYELRAGSEGQLTTYVRTQASNVAYTAYEAIDFASAAATETLNLTLTGSGNRVSMQSSSGTLALDASDADAEVTVDSSVDVTLSINAKSSVSLSSTLDASDTLYLTDGGQITNIAVDSNVNLVYGSATVKDAFAAADTAGKFNYSNGHDNGVVAYGADGSVDYASDVTYYTRATELAVDTDNDVVINLDGATGVQYDSHISVISGVAGGLIAGRSGKDNSITIDTEQGHTTQVYGGAGGADSITLGKEEDATNVVWYSLGDGKDSVENFGNGSDTIYFHNAYAQTKLLSDALKITSATDATLSLTDSDVLQLTKSQLQGRTLSFTDIGGTTYKVAVADKNNTVAYAADTRIYKSAGSNTTLTVDGSEYRCIYTGGNNDQYGYYDDNIRSINAANATGTLRLSGTNVAGFTITGGKGINHLYGGGNKSQTLVGTNSAVDVFWFGSGDGNDTATKAEATDGLFLYNVESIDDVKVTVGTSYFTVNVGSDNLKVNTGEAKATSVLQGFTFANQAGTLYTYDTTTKSFQQK